MKTKLLGTLMALAVAVTSLPVGTTANAAETDIVQLQEEENVEALGATEEEVKASAIQLTSGIDRIDALQSGTDIKWYKFTVPKACGYTSFSLKAQNVGNTESEWNLRVYKESDLTSPMFQMPWAKNYQSDKYTHFVGTYYISVSEWSKCENVNYSINVKFTFNNAYECEDNNSVETANVLTSGKIHYGSVQYSSKDIDYWKINVPHNGYISAELGLDDILKVNDGYYTPSFNLHLIDSKQNIIYVDGGKTKVGFSNLYVKSGTYYIYVDCKKGTTYFDTYNLKVTAYELDGLEGEYNNKREYANVLKNNISYRGEFQSYSDTDWYAFNVAGNGAMNITFSKGDNVSIHNVKSGWRVEIFKGNLQKALCENIITSKKNVKLSVTKGIYYVKVSNASTISDMPCGVEYNIKVNYTKAPKAVKITSATGGKKRATIKWTKSTDASGYYIYRATSKSGTYKKIATITKKTTVKYTDKKALKSKKTYYYKVVAYKKTNGLVATSSASKIKSVKTK